MLAPVLSNRNYFFGYALSWAFVTVVDIFIHLYLTSFNLAISITDSIVNNLIFAVIGIGIWYPVYYTNLEKNQAINFLLNHLGASSLTVGLWLWLTYIIGMLIFVNNDMYIEYYNLSLPYKAGVGYLLYIVLALNYYLVIYYQNFKEKMLKESELKALVKESELKSLKFQINPHFLFNSLNSISSFTMINPEKAQEMVINLSNFLRYSLSHNKESLSDFEKELENIERYLSIEKIRFGNRINLQYDINESCITKKLPGLILQPLVENAIKYGVYENTKPTLIKIFADCDDKYLRVAIINNFDDEAISKKGEGIGLKNVQERMQIQYGDAGLFKIIRENNTFKANLTFPQGP